MMWNALGLTALYLGAASAARDWLIGFLNERTPAAITAVALVGNNVLTRRYPLERH